jgi:hypothetical protein
MTKPSRARARTCAGVRRRVPQAEMFLDPQEGSNLQHIVAAYTIRVM